MSYSCLDHGHDCPRCEERLEREKEKEKYLDTVKGWDGNLNIFEIYDEIRNLDEHEQRGLMKTAFEYYISGGLFLSMLAELQDHLEVDWFYEDEEEEDCNGII